MTTDANRADRSRADRSRADKDSSNEGRAHERDTGPTEPGPASSLASQLRSVLTEEAQHAPGLAGLTERVRTEAGRDRRRQQVRILGAVVAVAAVVTGLAVLPPILRGSTATPGPAANATDPKPTDPSAMGPNVTAPNVTAPNASAPNASAPNVIPTGGVSGRVAAIASRCPTQDNALADPGHLPANLGPVTAAYTCWSGTHDVLGNGTWNFREVRRVTGGLEATLRAYAVPDVPTPVGGACEAIGYLRRVIVLDVGGKIISAREPVTTCEAPVQSAVAAYEAMTTEVVSSVRLNQVESPLSAASGCPWVVKDMTALWAGQPRTLPSTPPSLPQATGVTACVYTSVHSADPSLGGTLTAATKLTADEYEQVRTLVARATVDQSCASTAHTRFVVLQGGNAMPWTEIALDGCGVDQMHGVWRAPAGLQSLLVAALKHQIVVN